jgi:hypothetical protein
MSNDLFSLPSLVIACIFGALAIFLTLVGICKAFALVTAPSTPELLQDARVNLSKIKRNRSAESGDRRRQRRSARRPEDTSPPRLSGSGQPPVESDLFTPIHRPVACRNSSVQTVQSEQLRGKTWGRPILGRHRSSSRLSISQELPDLEFSLRDNWAQVSSSDTELQTVRSEHPPSPRDKLFTTSFH